MGIYRQSSGLIFDEVFSSFPPDWSVSPSGSYYLSNGLVLTHSEGDTMFTFSVPDNEVLSFDVIADYVPTEVGDEGGIIVWQDGTRRLEFLESKDNTSTEYSRWRAVKQSNRWTFYADRGFGWELFDTAVLPATQLGVILKGYGDGFKDLKLVRAVLCKGTTFIVGDLYSGLKVQLCDASGQVVHTTTVPEGWSGVTIPLPTIPYTGFIKLLDSSDSLISKSDVIDIYGGDVFLYGADLIIIWDGKELSPENPTFLGPLYNGEKIVRMQVYNPSPVNLASQVSVGVMQYMDNFGYQWVDVAVDINGTPGDFGDRIQLGDLSPQASVYFWVKVVRDPNVFSPIKPGMFFVDVTHS